MSSLKIVLRACWLVSRQLMLPIRGWFAARIQAWSVSSIILGPPKGIYETSQEGEMRQREAPSSPSIYHYTQVLPAQEIYRTAPKTIDQDIHWKFSQQYQQSLPETFLVEIEEGRFCIDSRGKFYTAVITANDHVVGDLSTGFTSSHHLIFSELKLPKIRNIRDSIVILSDTSDRNYFHWLFDALPKLYLLKAAGILLDEISYIGVVSGHSSFRKETLDILGINSNKIIELRQYPHIKAQKLIVPSFPGKSGNPPAWSCAFLRDQFLPYAIAPATPRSRRVYISRNDAKYRHVTNEAEIIEILKDLSFQIIELQFFSVAEQIALFLNAEVIIAPHGAGLANLVFCQPGTQVIELLAPGYVNVCYWALSQQVSIDYYYLIGEGNPPVNPLDIYESRKDITIDLDKFKRTLMIANLQ